MRFAPSSWLGMALIACSASLVPAQEAPKTPAPVAPLPVREMRAVDGRFVALSPSPGGASVVLFYSTECPISNAYSPALKAIADEFASKPLTMVGVCVDADSPADEILKHSREFDLPFPVVQDRDGSIVRRFQARVTPEVFVYGESGSLRYRGRIDDQYAARGKRNASASTHDLRDAIAATLDGKSSEKVEIAAVGCPVPTPPDGDLRPTYSGNIAAIINNNCVQCHRVGQVGPFALENYEQARKRAFDIASVTTERLMPPWKPDPSFGPALKHSKALTGDEIATLAAWAEAGAPVGDPSRVPPAPTFSSDWTLGQPDLVIETPEYTIPAEGEDIYRCFVIPAGVAADKFVTAIEYKPGNRKAVHHVLGYVDVAGAARKKDAKDGEPGYMCFSGPGVPTHGDLGGWAPGVEPASLPSGVGRSLPKGSDVIIQVHYHPTGKPETDRTRVGLYFSREPIRQTLHWNAALNIGMKLPAGGNNTEIKASWKVPVDVEALGVAPHMHLLGKDMAMTATLPDGKSIDLVKINYWDFDWQNNYWFQKPVMLPEGSTLRVVAHFDNSTANPRNPRNPPVDVKWGEATTDEMCIGFLAMVKKGQDLTRPGDRDDLNEIFRKQAEERIHQYEERMRKARNAERAAQGN